VQGKALVPALLASLCLLSGGCGGGGGGQSQSAPQGSESSARAKAPQRIKKAAGQLKDSAAQIKIKRERETHPVQDGLGAPSDAQEGKAKAKLPPVQPANPHHDSGGGTAQFATKTADNSIQESGTEGSAAETQAAAAVLHAYLDARVARRWSDACFYLSAGFAATIETLAERYAKDKAIESCPEVLEAFVSGSSQRALIETARADVGALRIEGDHGFLLYHGPGGVPYAMPMVIEGRDWKVGSLEGTPLL
jgi:hypothetical protein